MSFEIDSPECFVRSEVARLVLYRNPEHEVHKKKAAGRDPKGERSPQPHFWKDCVHFAHQEIAETPAPSIDEVQERYIDLAFTTLRDTRDRPRSHTLKLGIYNPFTDIQAKIRALRQPVRTSLVEKGFHHFVNLCSEVFRGPMIVWSHPDKIRMHFEVLALLYDPKTRSRFPWAKGLYADGAGATTFAEMEGDHPPAYEGFNSVIAGKMAGFLREQLRQIEKQMAPAQREEYELNTLLQHVVLELTLHEVSQKNRIARGYQRPQWLDQLVTVWSIAPGPERIEAKIDDYVASGLVDARGFPCVVPSFMDAGANYTEIIRVASKPSPVGKTPSKERQGFLEFWIEMLAIERRHKGVLRRMKLGATRRVFIFEDERVFFNGEVMEEIEASVALRDLYFTQRVDHLIEDVCRGQGQRNSEPSLEV
jgi:hypothetical protein